MRQKGQSRPFLARKFKFNLLPKKLAKAKMTLSRLEMAMSSSTLSTAVGIFSLMVWSALVIRVFISARMLPLKEDRRSNLGGLLGLKLEASADSTVCVLRTDVSEKAESFWAVKLTGRIRGGVGKWAPRARKEKFAAWPLTSLTDEVKLGGFQWGNIYWSGNLFFPKTHGPTFTSGFWNRYWFLIKYSGNSWTRCLKITQNIWF